MAAVAVVIPSMAKRSPSDITDYRDRRKRCRLDYLFDRAAFVEHLTKGCAGMRLYDRAEDFPGYERRTEEPLSPGRRSIRGRTIPAPDRAPSPSGGASSTDGWISGT